MKQVVIGTTGVMIKEVYQRRGQTYTNLFNGQVEVEQMVDGVFIQTGDYRPGANGNATMPQQSEPEMTPAERRALNAQRTAEFIRQRKLAGK